MFPVELGRAADGSGNVRFADGHKAHEVGAGQVGGSLTLGRLEIYVPPERDPKENCTTLTPKPLNP